MRGVRTGGVLGLALVGGLLVAGCFEAGTDRETYPPGSLGKTTFHNGSDEAAFLLGCAIPFTLEQRVDGAWETRFSQPIPVDESGDPLLFDLVCGPAPEVPAGGSIGFTFSTAHVDPLPGELRIRYRVGSTCTQTVDLGDGGVAFSLAPICEREDEVVTATFRVESTD